jgi:hypothetical protein
MGDRKVLKNSEIFMVDVGILYVLVKKIQIFLIFFNIYVSFQN